MTSHDLMNINPEAYKYTRSAVPSRSKWRLIDIIAINYIISTHNLHLWKAKNLLFFNHMLPVKIRPAIPKPWQVKHEIIKFASCFLPNFLYTADFYIQNTILRRRLLAFYRCIKIINLMENNDFIPLF